MTLTHWHPCATCGKLTPPEGLDEGCCYLCEPTD